MWLGWSSRVRLPERKTDDSLSNVSEPSGAGYDDAPSPAKISCEASDSVGLSPGGTRPPVTVARPASAEPRQKPAPNAWRMFRTARRSRHTNDERSAVVVRAEIAAG